MPATSGTLFQRFLELPNNEIKMINERISILRTWNLVY
jgi:hypothetical protein